jgi:hypothetical protein
MNRKEQDLDTTPKKQPWKIQLAARLRQESGASLSWLASRLQLGASASLRSYLCRMHEPAET